jgi:hypothetical protein
MLAYRVQPGVVEVETVVVDGMTMVPLNTIGSLVGDANVDSVGSGLPTIVIGIGAAVGVAEVVDEARPGASPVQPASNRLVSISKTSE